MIERGNPNGPSSSSGADGPMGSTVGGPIGHRGRSLLEQVLRIAQTRLEILSAEVQQEKQALTRQMALAAGAVLCGFLAVLTLVLWVALALPPDTRFVMLGVLFVALSVAAIASALVLRRRARREPLFHRVVQQLHLDRVALRGGDAMHGES